MRRRDNRHARRGRSNKAKGSGFEREVCKRLSLWVSHGKRDDLYWRSAMSGGRASVLFKRRGKKSISQAGDISCIHPDGAALTDLYLISCKFLQCLDIHLMLEEGVRGRLAHAWKECRQEAENHEKKPLLIAKENRGPTLVILEGEGDDLLDDVGISYRAIFPGHRACVLMFDDLTAP